MAKVKGPLFSLDARGQIAKTLVYIGWKGIKDVREYVIPANPKTDDQKKQRGYFGDAVEAWHIDGFTAIDVAAWDLYALALKVAASGFNMFARLRIKNYIALQDWRPIVDCLITAIAADGAQINITSLEGEELDLYWGTSMTSMFNKEDMVDTAGDHEVTLSACTKSTTIYFYVINQSAITDARTGIYSFKTLAA